MMRRLFYVGSFMLLIPWAYSWTDPDDTFKNLRTNVCKSIDWYSPTTGHDNILNFDENWNAALVSAIKELDDYYRVWGFSIKATECPKDRYSAHFSKTYNDMKCFISDLEEIGQLIKADLDRFKAIETSYDFVGCHSYLAYLEAWYQNPLLKRFGCHSFDKPTSAIIKYVYASGMTWKGPLAEWNVSPEDYVEKGRKCGAIYSQHFAKNLRKVVDEVCDFSTTETMCYLKLCFNIADSVDKLLEYTKSSVPVTDNYLNALVLSIFAAVRKLNQLYPNWEDLINRNYNDQLESTYFSNSWASSKMNVLTEYVFNNMDKVYDSTSNIGKQVFNTIDLLPVDYHCPTTQTADSFCYTTEVFDGMVQTLKQNTFGVRKQRKVQVNTRIDYKKFLEQTQQEQLLKIATGSQNNLLDIASDLRNDIVHSLEQSLGNTINENANEIKQSIQTGFGSLRKHFQQEASFDKEIAKADIIFIKTEIDKYVKFSDRLQGDVSKLVGNILYYGFVAATGDNVEKAVQMAIHIASMFNPLKWLTDGTSVADVMDASAEYMQSVATLLKTDVLKEAWFKLYYKARSFAYNLGKNQDNIDNVRELIDSLSTDTPPSNFKALKDEFIKQYNEYSPGANKKDLAEINTYWELLIDEGCDLIDSTEGSVSGGAKIALGSTCMDAKGEVQKLMALNEEIFDFQFDMMDALADCVRASNSFESASSITAGLDNIKEIVKKDRTSNVLKDLKILATYSTLLYRTTVLEAKENYCNVLEYKEGRRPDVCKTHDWQLSTLLSRRQTRCVSTQDFKVMPTRPAFSGDRAFISLKDLYAGKMVRFQVPNSQWLVEQGWISSDESSNPIFVQRFEVYLPVRSASERNVLVTATPTTGNQLRRDRDSNEPESEYITNPRRPLSFSYKEGQSSCRNEKIPNPYNSNCRSLPALCQVSVDVTESAMQEAVFPSIYTMWNIHLTGYESANLSLPATDIHLKIGLQTCSPESSRKKRSLKKSRGYLKRMRRSTDECCEGNFYVNEGSECVECPVNSIAKYNGLICECQTCLNGGTVYRDGNNCSCSCHSDYKGERCETRICNGEEEFVCSNKKCIPKAKYCDKVDDCGDNSDEPDACEKNYTGFCDSGFQCKNDESECVPNHLVCDGKFDCSSSIDEATCMGKDSEDCPDGWMYYAGTCFLFKSDSVNGTYAQKLCEEAGGSLANLTKDSEHWFLYTTVLNLLTGKTLAPGYFPRSTNDVYWANAVYDMPDSWALWWIGHFEEELSGFKYPFFSGYYSDDSPKCLSVRKEDWNYMLKNCEEHAEGFVCSYRPEITTTTQAPTSAPTTTQETEEGVDKGALASSSKVLQDINKGIQDIRGTLKKGFLDINDYFRRVLQNLKQQDTSGVKTQTTMTQAETTPVPSDTVTSVQLSTIGYPDSDNQNYPLNDSNWSENNQKSPTTSQSSDQSRTTSYPDSDRNDQNFPWNVSNGSENNQPSSMTSQSSDQSRTTSYPDSGDQNFPWNDSNGSENNHQSPMTSQSSVRSSTTSYPDNDWNHDQNFPWNDPNWPWNDQENPMSNHPSVQSPTTSYPDHNWNDDQNLPWNDPNWPWNDQENPMSNHPSVLSTTTSYPDHNNDQYFPWDDPNWSWNDQHDQNIPSY